MRYRLTPLLTLEQGGHHFKQLFYPNNNTIMVACNSTCRKWKHPGNVLLSKVCSDKKPRQNR
jgi:hypothetical protein